MFRYGNDTVSKKLRQSNLLFCHPSAYQTQRGRGIRIMWIAVVVISLTLFFAFSNGFHDAANVVSTIIMTKAISPRRALLMAAACEFIAPFFIGSAVAKTIGENIISLPAYDPKTLNVSIAFLIAALVGAILWNLITWLFGFPSSSSHALIGGMVGAVSGRLRAAQNSVGRTSLCCRFPCSFAFDRLDFWDVIFEDDSPYLSTCHPQSKLPLQPDADSFLHRPRSQPWLQ